MTDLERDDRALIEALKAELIEARNKAETRSIHNARLRSERDVAMEEVERLNGVTEALEKTVKDLIAQHREAKDEVERERAKLKSECTGCEKTARLEDAVARLDAVLKSEVLAYEKQVVGMMDQVSVLNAEVERLTDRLVRAGDINLELESLILERLPENASSIPLEKVNEWLDGWNRRAIKALLSTENEDRWRLAPTKKLDGLVTSLRVEPGVATPEQVQARYKATVCAHGSLSRSCELCERDEEIAELKATLDGLKTVADETKAEVAHLKAEKDTLAEVSRAIIDRLERENKDLLRDALTLERVKSVLATGGV